VIEAPGTRNRGAEALSLWKKVLGYRCAYLLVALVILLLSYPLLSESAAGRVTLGIFNILVLAFGAFATNGSAMTRAIVGAIALTGTILVAIRVTGTSDLGDLALGATLCIFYGIVVIDLLVYVLKRDVVTADKFYGAVAGYLMLAAFFAVIFAGLNEVRPNEFIDLAPGAAGRVLNYYDLLYVSFGALTAMGFDQLAPAGRFARSLVNLETVTGIFYVALLIARLTGVYR
jgi:hypothetical protein